MRFRRRACSSSITALGALSTAVAALITLPPTEQQQRPFLRPAQAAAVNTSSEDALIHASIEGIYINHAHSHSHPNQSAPSRPITLFFHTDALDPRTAVLTVSAPRHRSRDQVMLECGRQSAGDAYPVGGLEACERDDMAEAQASTLLEARCTPLSVSPEKGELVFDAAECPAMRNAIASSRAEQQQQPDELVSFTFTVTASSSGRGSSEVSPQTTVSKTFWVGHLRYKRGKWPMTHDGDIKWEGVQPNKMAGLFHDPYIPRAARFNETDDLQGVDIDHSHWSLGLSLRVPTVGLGDEKEPVHAPVGGEVVWVGKFRRPRPPAPENDEKGWAVMLRDEWGFVWQFFRLARQSITVVPGDLIPQGHVLGAIRRTPLSAYPPVRKPPADPPLEKPDKGTPRYPFRFRSLQVNVARPNPEWDAWRGPYEDGWSYFNPVHFLSEGDYLSTVPPYADPATLFFARPSLSPSHPPLATLSSADVVTPVLSGSIEILVLFDAFLETPGKPGDGMDAVSVYALEWALWPALAERGEMERGRYGRGQCVEEEEGVRAGGRVRYTRSFEHDKFPPTQNTSQALSQALFAHYVPTFTHAPFKWWGRAPRTTYASQFDEKARTLVYAPTRVVRGRPDVRGSWDTRGVRNGVYWVSVRARDYYGQVGCVTAQVRVFNLGG